MSIIELKNHQFTKDRRLDLLFDPAPIKKRHLFLSDNRQIKTVFNKCDKFLDQGSEGACVGFGVTHGLISLFPDDKKLDKTFAREDIYWEAQKEDPWPGGSYPGAFPRYEGTTTSAGLKEAVELKYLESFKRVVSGKDALIGLQDGPVVLGLNWYEGMQEPDSKGYIKPIGANVGGHCIYLEGVDANLDRVIFHNSWGTDWGIGGRCYMTVSNFIRLFDDNGEGAVLFPGNPFQEEKDEESITSLLKKFFDLFTRK